MNIKNVSHQLIKDSKIKPLNYQMNEKSLTLITGANGSGKSSLLKIIAGMIRPKSGKISNPFKTAYVPDSSENYFLGLTPLFYFNFLRIELSISTDCFSSSLEKLFKDFNFSSNLLNHEISSLSLGEKKKVMIIGAFLNDPDLFLMDEPFSGLDNQTVQSFLLVIESARKKGKKFMIVSHDSLEWFNQIDDIISL